MYHIITGNGKGKTTSAIGMSMRAAGAGLNVFFAQFVKGKHYSEHESIKLVPNIEIELLGRTCFIDKAPEKLDYDIALAGWERVKNIVLQQKVHFLVLDELHIALYYKLLSVDDVFQFIKQYKISIELVSTGRNAPEQLIEIADLVSEIKEIKHYYNSGVEARKGIEY